MANWYRANRLAVNTSKSKYIIFHGKGKKINFIPQIFYNSNEIGAQNDPNLVFPLVWISNGNDNILNRSYKLLGIYFDENLNFEKNINYICAKRTKGIYFLRRVQSFLSTKALRSLYFALFHSHLLYCINITSCANATNVKKIQTLQKKLFVLWLKLTTLHILHLSLQN